MNFSLQDELRSHGQEHLLHFWDQLSVDEQQRLATQIQAIDFELIDRLWREPEQGEPLEALAMRAEVPPAITLKDLQDATAAERARQSGIEALRAGQVGMVLVAGGQGSRLGFPHPKGMFPIGPVSDATLYQIHFEKVMARASQFGAPIPMYVMTSPPTHQETSEFLKTHAYFGMDPSLVRVFCQGVMPAVDDQGKLLLATRDSLFLSPNGHGGTLAGLADHGCLEHAEGLGVEHLFYGQVDNPLIQTCDPALIGYHRLASSEMTSQVVRKQDPLQKVGNVVEVDGSVRIIEYSDLPEAAAKQTVADGGLKLWAGSIAVHVFDLAFLKRCSQQAESLPYHHARKKVPFVDASGATVQPEQPNATKFERFIFDLLPSARNAIVCEVDPADGFCALKNAPPATAETEAHVRQAISDLHRRWLEQAGVTFEGSPPVEISPLFAVDADALKQRNDLPESIEEPTFLKASPTV